MADFTVFYGAQVYGEYTHGTYMVGSREFPDGCFILYPSKNWYLKQFGSLTPVNISDLSKEVKTLCLIMGIPI